MTHPTEDEYTRLLIELTCALGEGDRHASADLLIRMVPDGFGASVTMGAIASASAYLLHKANGDGFVGIIDGNAEPIDPTNPDFIAAQLLATAANDDLATNQAIIDTVLQRERDNGSSGTTAMRVITAQCQIYALLLRDAAERTAGGRK